MNELEKITKLLQFLVDEKLWEIYKKTEMAEKISKSGFEKFKSNFKPEFQEMLK